MAKFEVMLPAMGEGIIEATITRWLVSDGQSVKADQPLVEVATDKVDSEIPSPVDGTILRLVYREGETPRIGEVIALIETGLHEDPASHDVKNITAVSNAMIPSNRSLPRENKAHPKNKLLPGDPYISPLVRMLARQHGLSAGELQTVPGSGAGGRITKEDIRHYLIKLRGKEDHPVTQITGDTPDPINAMATSPDMIAPGDEVVEMDRVRKLIAGHMILSKRTAAHVTSFLEADVTALVNWREKNKNGFYQREQVKLTFTPVFIEALAMALKEFPRMNVSVSGDQLILRKNIHIGFATALPNGNLIVPVIKNADFDNLQSLARKVADLSTRARNATLLPADITGGTFTITNIGQYNNLTGTPIINQPESAILAMGTIYKKPWAVKVSGSYGVAIRDIIMLSLTYDHRVIDGALGGGFLSCIASHLENFDVNRKA